MKCYIVIINQVPESVFASLKRACEDNNVSYNSALKGKRVWVKKGNTILIQEVDYYGMQNRGVDHIR